MQFVKTFCDTNYSLGGFFFRDLLKNAIGKHSYFYARRESAKQIPVPFQGFFSHKQSLDRDSELYRFVKKLDSVYAEFPFSVPMLLFGKLAGIQHAGVLP